MACSFQTAETGYDHQNVMPAGLPGPENLPDDFDRLSADLKDAPEAAKSWLHRGPIEIRAIDPTSHLNPQKAEPEQLAWMRARDDVGNGVAFNQIMLAYASDYSLLGTAMRPHGVSWASPVQTASLDHIIWFHRPTNFARWHLYVQDSPSASGARGFNRGAVYREDGVLVASTAQEGLIRPRH
jgi:acyl-CoA thioesterase-2